MTYTVEVLPAVRKAMRRMDPDTQAGTLNIIHNLGPMPRPLGVKALRGIGHTCASGSVTTGSSTRR